MTFSQRRALITGGTRGIGLAIARRLAKEGCEVIATYAHDEDSAQAAQRAAKDEGLLLSVKRCDVTQRIDWERLYAREGDLYKNPPTVLVHAAGFTRDGLMMMMPEEDFSEVLDVHLVGAYRAVKAAMKGMISARTGRVIFLTSPTAFLGRPGQSNYGAAKAGLMGLMRSLIWEVSRFQITVNCVCAGLVDTALTADLSPAIRAELLSAIPLGRAGLGDEVASAVTWLASDQASYVTGQTLSVDGGLTAPSY